MYNSIVDEHAINNIGKLDDIAKNLLEDDFYNKLYNDEYNNYDY